MVNKSHLLVDFIQMCFFFNHTGYISTAAGHKHIGTHGHINVSSAHECRFCSIQMIDNLYKMIDNLYKMIDQ